MWNQPTPWGYPPPQQPVVFIPPTAAPSSFDIDGITRQIAGLEALKKLMKEEKKDDKDPKDKKKSDVNVLNVALLMLLLAPITGPIMSHFFQWGLSLLPH